MPRDCYGHTALDSEMFLRENNYKRSDKKTNEKQFKILEKDVYVIPDEIFEAFVGIANDLTMNDDEYMCT